MNSSNSSTQALLLRRTPFGESSLVVRVLTPDQGRVDLVAKGAYRTTSRFFAVLDWFHTLQVGFRPKAQGLTPLQNAEWQVRRKHMTERRDRYLAGLTVLELCDVAAQPGMPEPGLFELATGCLDHLNSGSLPADLELVLFEAHFLELLGVAPALLHCASCGGAAPTPPSSDRAAFSAGSGGRLCANCALAAHRSGRRVGTLPIQVLEAAHSIPSIPRDLLACNLPDTDLVLRVRDLHGRYLDYHLESRLRTQQTFLGTTHRNAPERGPAPSFTPPSQPHDPVRNHGSHSS
ncbi:MAG: DNA repair protein RecO (recombination protein O) [Glaciecola sp.]|jgi:DNA repair protein RecO (recombination protein O)